MTHTRKGELAKSAIPKIVLGSVRRCSEGVKRREYSDQTQRGNAKLNLMLEEFFIVFNK